MGEWFVMTVLLDFCTGSGWSNFKGVVEYDEERGGRLKAYKWAHTWHTYVVMGGLCGALLHQRQTTSRNRTHRMIIIFMIIKLLLLLLLYDQIYIYSSFSSNVNTKMKKKKKWLPV